MFKQLCIVFVLASIVSAKPSLVAPGFAAPLVAAPAPLVAPAPIVTAASSQYYARNYNGFVAAPAPLVAAAPYIAPAARIVAPAPVAVPAPYFAPASLSAPLVASPYARYLAPGFPAPLVAPSPFAAPYFGAGAPVVAV